MSLLNEKDLGSLEHESGTNQQAGRVGDFCLTQLCSPLCLGASGTLQVSCSALTPPSGKARNTFIPWGPQDWVRKEFNTLHSRVWWMWTYHFSREQEDRLWLQWPHTIIGKFETFLTASPFLPTNTSPWALAIKPVQEKQLIQQVYLQFRDFISQIPTWFLFWTSFQQDMRK